MAGRDHAVHTVEGGNGAYRRSPCSDCPWRTDAAGVFPAEAFRHSANTGVDGAYFSPDAMHTFACHQSGKDRPATCAGYILRSDDAIGWRIAVAVGKFDPAKVSDDGIDLHDCYFDMAVANGVPEDDPAIQACKPWRHDR
jgi:hypothetical protein